MHCRGDRRPGVLLLEINHSVVGARFIRGGGGWPCAVTAVRYCVVIDVGGIDDDVMMIDC
jgi:hypothetical protein